MYFFKFYPFPGLSNDDETDRGLSGVIHGTITSGNLNRSLTSFINQNLYSPHRPLCISFNVSSENLVVNQANMPKFKIFAFCHHPSASWQFRDIIRHKRRLDWMRSCSLLRRSLKALLRVGRIRWTLWVQAHVYHSTLIFSLQELLFRPLFVKNFFTFFHGYFSFAFFFTPLLLHAFCLFLSLLLLFLFLPKNLWFYYYLRCFYDHFVDWCVCSSSWFRKTNENEAVMKWDEGCLSD